MSQGEVLSRGNDPPYSSPLGLYLQVCLCSVLDGKQGRKKRRGEEKWSSVVQAFKHTVSFAAAKAFMAEMVLLANTRPCHVLSLSLRPTSSCKQGLCLIILYQRVCLA